MAVPAAAVADVVEACGRKGVGGLVVVSSHFAEDGAAGAALEREVARLAHSYGMRLVGPNCFGVLNTDPQVSMNATFAKDSPICGRLGFASQSGGLGIAILAEARKRGIGLSSFVSIGQQGGRQQQRPAVLVERGPRHERRPGVPGIVRQPAQVRPPGSAPRPVEADHRGQGGPHGGGRRAASSHTAALASSDEAVAAMCHQTGVIRVDTIEELFDVAQVLDSQPRRRTGCV